MNIFKVSLFSALAVLLCSCSDGDSAVPAEPVVSSEPSGPSTNPLVSPADCISLLDSSDRSKITAFLKHADDAAAKLRPVDAAVGAVGAAAGGEVPPSLSTPTTLCTQQLRDRLDLLDKKPG